MKRLALWQGLLLAIALCALLLGVHMFAIAPYRLELTSHRLAFGSAVRVLQVSDLHSQGLGRRERDLLELVRTAKPDLIVVTGDSVSPGAPCAAAAATLDLLEAPLGVWFVPGNWEYWLARQQGDGCVCPSRKVHCLRNQAKRLRGSLWIAGIDDLMAGHPEVADTLREVPAEASLIVLAHEPTAFDTVKRPALILAGHTHGGQICLPWLGPLVLPPESGSYASGWYQRGETRMYVSRGVGTSVIPARLWCTPELALFDLSV